MIPGHGSGRFDPGSEWVSDFPKGLTLDLDFIITALTRPVGSGQMGSGQGRPGFKAVLTRTAATLRDIRNSDLNMHTDCHLLQYLTKNSEALRRLELSDGV